MTSSPLSILHSNAAISRACVQEVVSNAFCVFVFSSIQLLHFFVKSPSPHIFLKAITSSMYSRDFAAHGGILNGIN